MVWTKVSNGKTKLLVNYYSKSKKGNTMKKASLVVAIVVSALVVGCQDSNFNNPVGGDFAKNGSSPAKNSGINVEGTLDLQHQFSLSETEGVDNTFDVLGTIQYAVLPTEDNRFFLFNLETDGNLQSLASNGAVSKIYDSSSDQIEIPFKQSISFDKVYALEGLEKAMDMHVKFNVSAIGVYIESVIVLDAGQF